MRSAALWRGHWHIYDFERREFLVSVRGIGICGSDGEFRACWTPGSAKAKRYQTPFSAQRTALRINEELYGHRDDLPCRPVQVVTGLAAECIDEINRRM